MRRYGAYLLFQLKTHASFFSEGEGDNQPVLSLVAALLVLTGITLVVAVSSECASAVLLLLSAQYIRYLWNLNKFNAFASLMAQSSVPF